MTEEFARVAQRALANAHRCEGSVCPDEDTLIAFADGRLPQAKREEVAAKVAACALCAAAVRAALDASSWSDDVAAEIQRPTDTDNLRKPLAATRPRRRTWLPLAKAASLVALVGAGLLLRPAPLDESLRGTAAVVTSPEEGAMLRHAPGRLAWPCDAAPSGAQVELLSSDANLLWSGAAGECAVTLPAQTRDDLQPGEYLWRVKNAAGDTLLGPIAFRISP